MKWSIIVTHLFLVIFTMLIFGSTGCRGKDEKNIPHQKEVRRVEVRKVSPGTVIHKIKITGEVLPRITVVLTPRVSGRLERLAVKIGEDKYEPAMEGTCLRKGQQIAVIDEAIYTAQKQQAKAVFAAARARYNDAEREAKRVRALFDAGAATEQMHDKALTALALCEAEVQQAEVALKLATINFEESMPVSPIDGIITRKHIDEGNIVTPATPIVTIEDMSVVRVIAKVPERYLPHIISGKTHVEIMSDILNGSIFSNIVSNVYPAVDRITRTATVEVLVDNPDSRLRSGNFVTLQMEISRAENVPVVPLSAIIQQGNENFVFVVENKTARRRMIRLGLREEEQCEVKEGVRTGELIVIQGQRDLRDGEIVEVFRKEKE